MTPARKSRRQSKPPAKLQDFVFQHGTEKEKEKVVAVPEKKKTEAVKDIQKRTISKSSTPEKKTQQSKSSLEKKTEQNRSSTEKKTQEGKSTSTTTPEKILDDSLEPRRSGRTPKISARLKSYLNEKSETQEKPDSSTKKPLKKVGEATHKVGLNDSRELKDAQPSTLVSKRLKLQAQGIQGTKGTQSTKAPAAIMGRIVNTEKKNVMKRKDVAETVSDLAGKDSKVKRARLLDCADGMHSTQAKKESVDTVKRINKDLMTELLNFGAEIIEAMSSSNEKIIELTTKENTKHKPLHTFEIDKDQDLDEDEVEKILDWIEKEDQQRRNYRKKILDSMRMSHESNMALFMQLLNMLKSLSASLRS